MWTCQKCKESIEDQFDTCWRCAGDAQLLVLDDTSERRKEFTRTKKILISLIVTVFAGGVAFILAAPDLATGRERIAPSLYPYAFLASRRIIADPPYILLILGQFLIYGVVFAWAWLRHRPLKAAAWIVFLHILLAFALSYLSNVERQYQTWPSN